MIFSICSHCLKALKVAAVTSESAFSAARILPFTANVYSPVEDVFAESLAHFSTNARIRTEEEKKSRDAARKEKKTAYEQFPFLPTRPTRQVYVLDKGLAGEIAKAVIKNQTDRATPVLEVNPGPGILTKALVKAGVDRIVLTESLKEFMPHIQSVQKQFQPNVLGAYNIDFLTVWRLVHDTDCISREFEEKVTSLFPHRDWKAGPPMSVVAVIPEQKEYRFLYNMIMMYGRQDSLYSLGRLEWFLAISPTIYRKLVGVKMKNTPVALYTPIAIILHLLFDIHFCAQLPGWKFTPNFHEKKISLVRKGYPETSNSMRYLVQLLPHIDQPLPIIDIPAFYRFLNQVMQRKKVRLILKMEQLVPGCGVHLIMLHFTMMTLVADVTPPQFLTIFKAMKTWPEYQSSPLQQILADSLSTGEDDGVNDTGKDS